jgi:hypothetical protein
LLKLACTNQVSAGDQSQNREALGLTVPPSLPAQADEVIE